MPRSGSFQPGGATRVPTWGDPQNTWADPDVTWEPAPTQDGSTAATVDVQPKAGGFQPWA